MKKHSLFVLFYYWQSSPPNKKRRIGGRLCYARKDLTDFEDNEENRYIWSEDSLRNILRSPIKIYYKSIGFVGELHITPTKRRTALPAKHCMAAQF